MLIIGSLSNNGWQRLQKCHKKMNAPYFKLYDIFYFYSILLSFSNFGKMFWSWILQDCIKVQEIIGSCFLLFPYSTKQEIRHFYSIILQQRQRNVQKSMMQVQRALDCCFANLNLLLFCFSCCYPCCHCLSSPMSPEWVNGPSNQVSLYLMALFYHWRKESFQFSSTHLICGYWPPKLLFSPFWHH